MKNLFHQLHHSFVTYKILNSILQLSLSYRSQSLDPTIVIDTCLKNVTKFKELNMFSCLTTDLAKTSSCESTKRHKEGKPLGVLDGIPIAVKDNFCTKNIKTTCASR